MNNNTKSSIENVSKKLVKISPRISVFCGVVASRTGKDELCATHGAARSAVGATVHLLPKHTQKMLRNHCNGIRNLVAKYSIPYDNGSRVMKAANYPKLRSELDKLIGDYKIFVQDEIVANYDEIVDMARVRLNGLFEEDMFPSKEGIADKYGVRMIVEPMTDTSNVSFMIEGLNQMQIDEIRNNLREEIESNIKVGQMKAIAELRDAVENIFEKTKKEDGARYKAAISSLIDKCNNIENTNVLEIPELTKVAGEIKTKLGKITSAAVKANPKVANEKIASDTVDLMSALDAINI